MGPCAGAKTNVFPSLLKVLGLAPTQLLPGNGRQGPLKNHIIPEPPRGTRAAMLISGVPTSVEHPSARKMFVRRAHDC